MGTVSEIVFSEQVAQLEEIASARGWSFDAKEGQQFALSMTAKDGEVYWLFADCRRFPAEPPAWDWFDPESGQKLRPQACPKGSGFLHSSRRICAPWNRSAYKEVDSEGPHGDWRLSTWQDNPKTGKCLTLSAMALRIFVELNGKSYSGRMK